MESLLQDVQHTLATYTLIKVKFPNIGGGWSSIGIQQSFKQTCERKTVHTQTLKIEILHLIFNHDCVFPFPIENLINFLVIYI